RELHARPSAVPKEVATATRPVLPDEPPSQAARYLWTSVGLVLQEFHAHGVSHRIVDRPHAQVHLNARDPNQRLDRRDRRPSSQLKNCIGPFAPAAQASRGPNARLSSASTHAVKKSLMLERVTARLAIFPRLARFRRRAAVQAPKASLPAAPTVL